MSRHTYLTSRHLLTHNPPFYSLIMAAMRRADTINTAKLAAAWPEVWAELFARYDAPGGVLPTDPEYDAVMQQLGLNPDADEQERAGNLTEA